MSQPLAVLHEPTPEQASRWYRPRIPSVAARFDALTDFFQGESGVRVVKRSPGAAELLIDVSGRPVRVRLHGAEIELRSGLSLIPAEPAALPSHRYLYDLEVAVLVEACQLGTGFYVYSEDLVAFEPSGDCSACHAEVFVWQEKCGFCSKLLYPDEEDHEEHAKRITDFLLRQRMIELVSSRGRRTVERVVAAILNQPGATPDTLLHSFLMDLPDVAEVYCEERALFQVLYRVR